MGAVDTLEQGQTAVFPGLVSVLAEAVTALDTYAAAAIAGARGLLAGADGKPDRGAFERSQHLAHGLSWLVTYVETLRQVSEWAARLEAEGKFGEAEALLSQILFSEYCAQVVGGIPMNQGETIRPHELGATYVVGDRYSMLQRQFPKTLAEYEQQIDFVVRELSPKGVKDLEALATALYVAKVHAGASADVRAKELHTIKPHVDMDRARASVAKVDEWFELAGAGA